MPTGTLIGDTHTTDSRKEVDECEPRIRRDGCLRLLIQHLGNSLRNGILNGHAVIFSVFGEGFIHVLFHPLMNLLSHRKPPGNKLVPLSAHYIKCAPDFQ